MNFSLYYNSVTKVVADFIPELGDKVGHEFCRPTFGHSYPLLSIGPKSDTSTSGLEQGANI